MDKKTFGPPDPSSVKQRNMVTMLANTNGSQTKSRTLVPSVTQKKNVQPSRPCTMSPTNSYIQKKPLLVEPPSTTLHAMIWHRMVKHLKWCHTQLTMLHARVILTNPPMFDASGRRWKTPSSDVSVPINRNSNTIQLCMTICMTHHTKNFLVNIWNPGVTPVFYPIQKPFQIDTQKTKQAFL